MSVQPRHRDQAERRRVLYPTAGVGWLDMGAGYKEEKASTTLGMCDVSRE